MANFVPAQTGNFEVCPVYTGSDGGVTAGVYLLPPAFNFGAPISFNVPLLYRGDANWQNLRLVNDDFALAFVATTPQRPTPAALPVSIAATITISANNAWKAAPAARQTLANNFVDFCARIEAQLEYGASPVLVRGATSVIAQQIAEHLPAPLVETLFYRFGFVPGFAPGTSPYVDLRRGMRLRIEPEASQFVAPGAPFNGYVAAAPLTVEVCSVADPADPYGRKLAFSPFFGAVAAPEIAPTPSTPNLIASGAIDLMRRGVARRYWRLFTPPSLAAGHTPGDLGLARNVVLVGADTRADLGAATAAMVAGVSRVADGSSAVYAILRGRAVATPEIPVQVSAGATTTTEWVAVGTTVAQLIERFTEWRPYAFNQQVVSLKRVTAASSDGRTLNYVPVNFWNNAYLAVVNDQRVFDVPLVRGDVLTLAVSDHQAH